MGLLDDAIREHLELKRLRGADPGEVVREEQEAFGAAPRVAPAERDARSGGLPPAREGHALDGEGVHAEDSGPLHLSQETVELDMRAILEADSIEGSGSAERQPPPAMGAASSRARTEPPAPAADSADGAPEWEAPGGRKQRLQRMVLRAGR